MSESYAIELKNITKRFGKVTANDKVCLSVKKGEILSILGENGSGKTTLMNMISGIYYPDEGQILVNGKEVTIRSPKDSFALGIGMIHQHFKLVDVLTAAENIILGLSGKEILDMKSVAAKINELTSRYGFDLDPNQKIYTMSVSQKQTVEIVKLLYRGVDILILDEPTAVLTPQEAERLFEILNNLKQDGKSLVFISHKLNEVMAISDRISVMRQGQYMGTVNKEETSPLDLTKRMIGREVFLNIDKAYSEAGDTILEVQDVWIPSQKETSKIRGMSLHVKAGEIVGVAGIDGNGQSELVEAITGLRKVEKGKILLCGKDITNLSPRKVRESGLSHIPEDRNTRGLNRAMTIEENLIAVRPLRRAS